MKVLALLLLVAAAANAASDAQKEYDVLGLLYRINEPITNKFSDLKKLSTTYKPSDHLGNFKDGGKAVTHIDKMIADEVILKKHHLFSLFDNHHRHNALMIVDVLLNSKDYETFVSSAAYYRRFMNEGAFAYAMYASVIHSKVTAGVVLPPLYEITPHMFVNSEIIDKAYSAKMTQTPSKFHMKFTGSKRNPEQRVAYFGEDIGMNVHHVSWHMDYPFWWKSEYGHNLDRKGELFFWMHHQLTARFDAERLSNRLNPVDELYWDRPIAEGFAPHTVYRYGGEFPARPDNAKFSDIEGIIRIRDLQMMEVRIRDAIAHGYVVDKEGKNIDIRNEKGIEILGDVMESSTTSPNKEYYGALHNFAHIALGRLADPKGKFNMPPGVMEHFETATRDPAFFRLHKYMDNIFKEHKDSLPPYTKDDVLFPAVAVKKVSIDGALETYFEPFEFDLSQAVDSTPSLPDVPISTIVDRLNHRDFSVNIDVINNKGFNVDATLRIFLCPRYDANGILYTLDEGRWHCLEMDKFWKNLNPGKNHIVRKSSDSATTVPDIPSFNDLLKKAESSLSSGAPLAMEKYSRSCGIPNRMLLPKGTEMGMEFSLVVVVTDGHKDAAVPGLDKKEMTGSHCQCGIHGEKYPDLKPLGFPLDRKITNEKILFKFPNVSKTSVFIKHVVHK